MIEADGMNKKKDNVFCIFNILLPIFIGAVIYYHLSPEVIFIKKMDFILGSDIHIHNLVTDNLLVKIVRNYLLDMMWGYALVFALFYILGNNTAKIWKIFLVTFFFSAAMEILQLTPIAKGTFDKCDIFVEFLAEIFAVFIIKKHFKGK